MKETIKTGFANLQVVFSEFFGLGRAVTISTILFVCCIVLGAVFWFFYSAPPHTITITSGPDGSAFQKNAARYAKILARSGIKLNIFPSEGSQENLKRLIDPKFKVDIGFVQGGVAKGETIDKLVSLGSVFYEPLMIFYRSPKPIELLSQLKGKRLAIGPEGSGTRTLALALLDLNGIKPGEGTAMNEDDSDDAAKALLAGTVDAVFMMGDSASTQVMRTLMRTPTIHLFSFIQADGYVRRINYLSKLELPKGSIDFGKNIPSQDVYLIGPTAEIIARNDLHPALSDLLLEAAREIHGSATLLRRQGEFPAPLEHEYRISEDASRFYKSGKTLLYRYLPFQLASLVNRFLLVFVPLVVLLIPGLKIIPAVYRWRINLGIYRWYRALLALEKDLLSNIDLEKRKELFDRLDRIEQAVNAMKVPVSFAEQFYVLRGHIAFVRGRLMAKAEAS